MLEASASQMGATRRRRTQALCFGVALLLASLACPRAARANDGPPAPIDENSTLAQWKAAPTSARSLLAVTLAKKRLPPDPDKLELAKTAMEISGCLTATAKDPRFAGWLVAPTSKTCLEAEERPAK